MIQFSLVIEDIARIIQAQQVVGDRTTQITHVQNIETATHGQLTFYAQKKFRKALEDSRASAIIVSSIDDCLHPDTTTYLICDQPHRAFVQLCTYLLAQPQPLLPEPSIHDSSIVHPTAQIHRGAVIQKGVQIGAHCVVGTNVVISSDTILYPNVTIYDDCHIGERCIIHAGAVIGSDGFGYLNNNDGSFIKIPQLGNVIVGNDCEIGSNTTIDRAALGHTRLGNGVKIDNLVHIAHNVEIGDDTAIAAQSGIAGGAVLGKRNRIAGQVGIVGYVTLCDDVTIGAQSGVSKSITKPGVYSGSPAVPITQRLHQEAAMRRISTHISALETLLNDIQNSNLT